jgi:hypothetical protein
VLLLRQLCLEVPKITWSHWRIQSAGPCETSSRRPGRDQAQPGPAGDQLLELTPGEALLAGRVRPGRSACLRWAWASTGPQTAEDRSHTEPDDLSAHKAPAG